MGMRGKSGSLFTDAVIKVVNSLDQPVVYILWVLMLAKKKVLITNPKHLIVESADPSPLSAYRGFFGKQTLSQANAFLASYGSTGINWLSIIVIWSYRRIKMLLVKNGRVLDLKLE